MTSARVSQIHGDPCVVWGSSGSPRLHVYTQNRNATTSTFVRLTGTVPAPGGSYVTGNSFSPDGNFLAVVTAATPWLYIYQRDGDNFTLLTGIAAPTTTGDLSGVSWSPDGQYVSMSMSASPYIATYKRSGSTFSKIANPGTAVSGDANCIAWGPDGRSIALGLAVTPFVNIYNFDPATDTYTKLSDPATLPTFTFSISWSSNGNRLAIGHNASPWFRHYQRSGDTFTAGSISGTGPGSQAQVDFNADGTLLAVASNTSPRLFLYNVSGSTATNAGLTIVGANPTVNTNGGVTWTPDSRYLAVGLYLSPYFAVFSRPDDTARVIRVSGPATLPPNNTNAKPEWWPKRY